MTPRERFYMVTSHPPKWPDRVCNEFIGAGNVDPVCIIDEPPYGYRALCDYLGITDYDPPKSRPIWGGVINVDERILKKFGCDFRYLPADESLEVLPNGYIRSYCGYLLKPSAYGKFYPAPEKEQPATKLKTLRDIENYPYWPDTESTKAREALEKEASEIGKIAKKMHEETNYVISGGYAEQAYSSEYHRIVRGFTQWFVDMRKNPEFYHAFANKMLQVGTDIAEIYLNAVGDYVDRVFGGPGDLGTQAGPMISLEDFREFCVPYLKKTIELTKKYTKAKISAHMCGSIHLYIEDLAELGIDIVGQQIGIAYHMEPERLKRDFGDMITFWGGIDVQQVLVHGTPAQVREWVKRIINALAPGLIIASTHQIQGDAPPQNVCAACEVIQSRKQPPEVTLSTD